MPQQAHHTLAALLLGTTLALAITPATAQTADPSAVQQQVDINIPRQPLDSALSDFIRQTGWQVGYSARLVANLTSNAAVGRLSPPQALDTLLQGTGISWRLTGPQQLVLQPAELAMDLLPIQVSAPLIPGSQGDAVQIDPTQTITVIGREELERTQPASLFDAIQRVPGLAVEGGPRPSGMTFNVRGYSDSEDVQVRVDNVPKDFEKYRFGGTFVEPELLKSIEVQRGPQIWSGSGSLGGTILTQTKDAADLLQPGRRYGARAKFSYADNNDEFQRSYTLYGRPLEKLDLLYNQVLRDSNDITHSDGSRLGRSAIQSRSQLLKVSILPLDSLQLTTSAVLFKDEGLQPFDATGADPEFFGNVIRSIEDWSLSETLRWTPDNPWIDLTATIGKGHTKMRDLSPPGFKRNNSRTHNDYEDRKFSSAMADIANTALLYDRDQTRISLLAGLQYNKIDRELRRRSDKPGVYPSDGFWATSISGKREYLAAYLQPRLRYNRLEIVPGIRVDQYEVTATDPRVRNHLAQKNRSDSVEFTQHSYSLGLSYDLLPEHLTLFANYGEGFRPPSVDEYFSYGSQAGALPGPPAFWPPFLPWNNPIGLGDPYGGGEGRCNTLDTNFICGDVYKVQTSDSREIGLSYQHANLFDRDLQVFGKFTYFQIRTSNLLNSLEIDPINNLYSYQNGWEKRYGNEIEAGLNYRRLYSRLAYSRTWGRYSDGNSSDSRPIYTVPGNTLNLTVGFAFTPTLGIDASYRKVSSRTVRSGSNTDPFTTQDGYEVFGAGAYWKPTRLIGFRVIGENLTNRDYHLNAGGLFGGFQGNRAAGRNVRFVTELEF